MKMGAIMIAKYITRQEYQCPCCGELPPDFGDYRHPAIYDTLFEYWEILRTAWGDPIRIGPPDGGGGYRCSNYNALIHGAYVSAHMFGMSLDPDLNTVQDVEDFCTLIDQKVPDLRVGKYTVSGTFVHMDTAWLIQPRAKEAWKKRVRWYG